ncbi:MAG: carboxylating nicotinate-nucleotide diphosphorylase [Dehalococcoidia bacterium]|jgi:nicotinate-nucleotide pyrophosphorylase (carboxylating)
MTGERQLDEVYLRQIVLAALSEDGAFDDVTTAALVPPDLSGKAVLLAKAPGVIAGLPAAAAVFRAVDPSLSFRPLVAEGSRVQPGDVLAEIEGSTQAILRGERVALNLLQRLSGIATATARLVDAVAGLPVRILDTRKTTPGLRALERYAVRMGGGQNHRWNLATGILVKDNHWRAVEAAGGSVESAVRQLRERAPGMAVEVEVTTVEEAQQALAASVDVLLLDNMGLEEMRRLVEMARGKAKTEASGGITEATVRAVAETGVDYISVGAITHSAPALDISLELVGRSNRRSGETPDLRDQGPKSAETRED